MLRNFLTPQQRANLLNVFDKNCSTTAKHALMLLLRNEGKTYDQIAKFLGCSYRTVAYWCCHGDPDNLETLADGRSKGNSKKITDEYIEILLLTARRSPRDFGYSFSHWSGEKLAKHLGKQLGISICGSQIRNILRDRKNATQSSGLAKD